MKQNGPGRSTERTCCTWASWQGTHQNGLDCKSLLPIIAYFLVEYCVTVLEWLLQDMKYGENGDLLKSINPSRTLICSPSSIPPLFWLVEKTNRRPNHKTDLVPSTCYSPFTKENKVLVIEALPNFSLRFYMANITLKNEKCNARCIENIL